MPERKRQQKQSPIIKSLEELISDYDRPTLVRELEGMKHNLAWKILKAALIKEYQNKVVYQMDLARQSNQHCEAAYEAGSAQTMSDIALVLIDRYIDLLAHRTAVTEDVRPAE